MVYQLMLNESPSVFAIIVTYKGKDMTLDCLGSLQEVQYANLHTVVVDNASDDGTVEAVRAQFPAIHVLEAGSNLSYSGGNNLGIEYALEHGADYLFILNNDVFLDPDIVDALVQTAEANPHAGMICPKVYYCDQPNVIWSAGSTIDMQSGGPHLIGNNEEDAGQYDEERPVQVIDGCAILVTRAACERIGLIDIIYFAYYEDVDWALRARQASFEILYTPSAKAWHKVSATSQINGKRSPFQVYYHMRNHLLFLSRYSRIIFTKHLAMWGTMVFNLMKYIGGYQRPISRARMMGILDYYRGRFGKQFPLHY